MISKHLRYLKYVIKHKYFVFVAGRKIGVPLWRLLIHDYSKFSRAEWTPYVNRFFSGNAGKEDKTGDPDEFHKAWFHHWRNNAHHWEYWLVRKRDSLEVEPQEMPEHFAREMVADWMGAGRAITGSWDILEWYSKTKDKQIIHPNTRSLVESLIGV